MGFKRKRKVYKLDFSGTEYEGLEVRLTGLTTGEYLEFVSLSAPGDDGSAETEKLLQLFTRHLLSWNLEDENGEPIPTSYEGVKSNDLSMNTLIMNAWTDILGNVPETTEKKSSSGETFPLASIPTETLSSTLVS